MNLRIIKKLKSILKKILLVFTVLSFIYSLLILSMVFFNKSVLSNSNFAIQELETLEKQGVTENFEKYNISYIAKEELIFCKNINGIKKYRDETISWIDYLLFKFASYFIISLALLCILLILKIKEKSNKVCDKCQM